MNKDEPRSASSLDEQKNHSKDGRDTAEIERKEVGAQSNDKMNVSKKDVSTEVCPRSMWATPVGLGIQILWAATIMVFIDKKNE